MNDLAEKALQGLDVLRRQVRDRPMISLAIAGFLVSAAVVVTTGRAAAVRPTRGLTTWFGLDDLRATPPGDLDRGLLALAALAVLVLLWLGTLEVVRRTRQPESRVWWVVAAWTVPFAAGPPLIDTGVYTGAAFGLIGREGNDPYTTTPATLGNRALVAAIDPADRGVPSGSGPLGSLLQHVAASTSAGSALGTVLILRAIGVVAAIAIGRLAADLGGARAGEALAITALNPLLLLFVVSSPHLDGVMVALALGAIVAADQRRWLVAVVLACAAGSVAGPGLVLVPIVIAVHLFGRRTKRAVVLARDVVAAVVVIGGVGLVGGFGWVRTVTDQFTVHTPYAIASIVGRVLQPIVRGASYDDLATSGRLTAATAAACAVVYLVVTARHRALERSAGFALLAVALLAPSLHPWYLLWGVLLLGPTALGERRRWVLTLSALGCALLPAGFTEGAAAVVTGVAIAVIALAVATLYYLDHRRTPPPDAPSSDAPSSDAPAADSAEAAADAETG